MQLLRLPIFTTLLAAAGAYAQTATLGNASLQQPSPEAIFNQPRGLYHRKELEVRRIDAYRSALITNPASGCLSVYATTILTDGFNPQYTLLGQFVAACGSL
ncbi:hypothetical protein DFH06DRAFT_1303390 [Mycena polygramma]|nr:hypothetical protein DFH06DRAFT_1303390 [Mycena polygramma]